MKWRSYPAYKQSGIESLGGVPEHWEVKKLKWFYNRINSGDGISPDLIEPAGSYPVYGGNGIMGFAENYNSDDADIIIGRVGAKCGNVYYVSGKKWISDNALNLSVTNCNKLFLLYFLDARNLNQLSNQNAQPLITGSMVGNQFIPLPPLLEQQAIATFLDSETKRIDTLVEKKERLIDLLREKRSALISHAVTKGLDSSVKLKSSGVEWLGEIPEHWQVSALKRIVATPVTDGPHETPEILDEGIPFVSAEAIKNDQIDFTKIRGFIAIEDHRRYSLKYNPRRDDIYIIKSGATTGNVAMVETDFEFNIWSPLAAIRPNRKVSFPRFLFHFVKSKEFMTSIQLGWTFGTQQNIGMNVIENLYVGLPPITEQQAIAAFLDREIGKIDTLIAKMEEAIVKLKEYRTALISAAVTGKIDVREAA